MAFPLINNEGDMPAPDAPNSPSTLTLGEDLASVLAGAPAGQEIECKITLKPSTSPGTFDVVSIEREAGEEAAADEEAMLGYKRPSLSKPSPDISAADLAA
jgi:hypothetical protein